MQKQQGNKATRRQGAGRAVPAWRGHRATKPRSHNSLLAVFAFSMLYGVVSWVMAGTASAKPKAAPPGKKSDPAIPASARLTVQGETVTADDIWLPYMEGLLAKAKGSSRRDLEEYVARQSAQHITDKIAEMLLYQKARLRLTDPMEKKIDSFVDAEIRKRVTADYGGIQRRMERDLEARGWSLDGYRAHLRRSIIISTYLDDELRPRVAEPTRAELLAAFHEAAESFRRSPRRSMSLIDVRVSEFLPAGEDASEEKQAEARTLARARITEAQAQLRNGQPFAEVAKKYSHGSKAEVGGAWGFVNPESVQDRFAPALERLATLQQGQVSDIIEGEDGFFIVRCDQLDPGTNPDFVSVQPQIREQLFADAYNRKIGDLVMELRKAAKMEPENLEPFHAAVVESAMKKFSELSALPKP